MKLVNKSISEFSELLATEMPVPGGTSAAAVQVAHGLALLNMVASLTIERKKYAKFEELMRAATEQVDDLRTLMLEIVDRDVEAFSVLSGVFKESRKTDTEIVVRDEAMQSALKLCALIPFEIIECALIALELASEMVGKVNANAIGDFGVAVLSLKSAAQGAWLCLLANLDGIRDEIFSAKYTIASSELVRVITELADNIYTDILNGLLPD